MMVEIANNPRSRAAMVVSIVVHAGIIALLFLKVFLSPDPPIEQERIMVSLAKLGDSNKGGGETSSQPETTPEQTTPQTDPTTWR